MSLSTAHDILTEDFKAEPYWWDAAPPVPVAPNSEARSFDVAVVGAGVTGLVAALELLRGGRSVVVFEKELVGYGASRRNAGFLGRVLKKSFSSMLAANATERARAVYGELNDSLNLVFDMVEREKIDCYAIRCGRFIAADSRAHFNELDAELSMLRTHMKLPYTPIADARGAGEFSSPRFNQGVVIPDLGSIHPGLYHKGLLERVIAAGGTVHDRTTVEATQVGSDGYELRTDKGTFTCDHVVMATNGYTTPQHGWFARRIVPFEGFMAATETLPEDVIARLLPSGRTVLNARTNIDFFRPAPDTSRILFGGATGSSLHSAHDIGARLQQTLSETLPDLKGVRLSHVWSGHCAGTLDMMPHMGRSRDGIWFGMGYNFAGVPMGSYFGSRIAHAILGTSERPSVFESVPFRAIPFYNGRPWFMPLVMKFFDWKDDRKEARNP